MKDIFEEFLSLSWNGHGVRPSKEIIEDVVLGDYIIARVSGSI